MLKTLDTGKQDAYGSQFPIRACNCSPSGLAELASSFLLLRSVGGQGVTSETRAWGWLLLAKGSGK